MAEKEKVDTILRTIWTFNVRCSAAGFRCFGRFGLVQVTDDALAAGAVPDPLGDTQSAWMLNFKFFQEEADNRHIYYEGDLKAKRKLRGLGQSIAIVMESDAASTATAVVSFGIRTLFSLK